MAVFLEPGDYPLYLNLLGRFATRHGLEVWAYCLLPNHVHLLVVPTDPLGLARPLQETHARYAEIVNRRSGWSGHLWQQRFFSAALDERHLYFASRYILRNPVRAGLVTKARDWPWSSVFAHESRVPDSAVADPGRLPSLLPDLLGHLDEPEDEIALKDLRQRTRTGRPLGDDDFILSVERRLGRSLVSRVGGRPRRRSLQA